MIEVKPSLKAVLKRLKLSGLVPLLPDRAAYANKTSLAPLDFFELVLSDEIERREHKNLSTRLDRAGFDDIHRLEGNSTSTPPSPSTATAYVISSASASWTATKISCSSGPLVSARPSSLRPRPRCLPRRSPRAPPTIRPPAQDDPSVQGR